MRTQNNKLNNHQSSCKRLLQMAIVLATSLQIQGCKTMQVKAFGEGLIRANNIQNQNIQAHRSTVEWNQKTYGSHRLPMRNTNNVQQIQQVSPAQSNNPSQQFLRQGFKSNGGY